MGQVIFDLDLSENPETIRLNGNNENFTLRFQNIYGLNENEIIELMNIFFTEELYCDWLIVDGISFDELDESYGVIVIRAEANETGESRELFFSNNIPWEDFVIIQYPPGVLPETYDIFSSGFLYPGKGVPVVLSGSEKGVIYDMYLGNWLVSSLPGTGAPLSFIAPNAGVYKIMATRSEVSIEMNGQVDVHYYPILEEGKISFPYMEDFDLNHLFDKGGGICEIFFQLDQYYPEAHEEFEEIIAFCMSGRNEDWDTTFSITIEYMSWMEGYLLIERGPNTRGHEISCRLLFEVDPYTLDLYSEEGMRYMSVSQPPGGTFPECNVMGGGEVDQGIHGQVVYLNYNQYGVWYSLYLRDSLVMSLRGSSYFGGLRDYGYYKIKASFDGEEKWMNGEAEVWPKIIRSVVGGGGTIYNSNPVVITLPASQSILTYHLLRDGVLVSVHQGTGAALSFSVNETGVYTMEAGIQDHFVPMTGSVTVDRDDGIHFSYMENHVVEMMYLDPTTSVSGARAINNVTYLDGFGRKLQEIQVHASPGNTHDIVKPYHYGVLGRVEREYVPYASEDNHGGFVSGALSSSRWNMFGVAESGYMYTLTEYDNSPLDRVVKQTGPGKNWHSGKKGITTTYNMNSANEVRLYRVSKSGALVQSGFYTSGSLKKESVADEDGKLVEMFKDIEDNTLLVVRVDEDKRLETYSVYDDRGLLRYVLSPEASAQVGNPVNETFLRRFAYYYEYDSKGRQILKRLPGCDPIYMVYDKKDRLVMSQDGKQRAQNSDKWSYSLYDNQNRVVETGEVVITGEDKTHKDLQDFATTSDSYIPPGTRTPLQYTLYDSYLASSNVPVHPFVSSNSYVLDYYRLVTGLVTSVKTKVLDTGEWLTITTYYDDRCRVIQTVSDNLQGQKSRVDFDYDFVGNLIRKKESHGISTSRTDILETENVYDDRGRLLNSRISLNGGSPAIITYSYNEIGQLMSRKLGKVAETMTYNPRGWIIGKESDPFKMKLRHESPLAGADTCWNGTISEWEWQHGTDTVFMYGFVYDGVNRLKETIQKRKSASSWVNHTKHFLEKNVTYDRNGNIKTLQRTAGGVPVDNLSYTYTGNQLTSLTESVRTNPGGNIYLPGSSAVGTYTYDKNGNLINDSRKSLNFTYNLVNLLSEVKTSTGTLKAKYSYLIDGTKLRVLDNGGMNGYDYLGSLTYKKSSAGVQLESAYFGGGVIRTNSGRTEVNYFLTDHLGSVRVIVDSMGRALERNDYYPFGARHVKNNYVQQAGNRYKYNGKEKQVTGDLGYLDYGARMYDNALGRWFVRDPFSEKYVGITPYSYCLSNPVNAIDPDGKVVIFINGNHYGDGGSSEYWRKYITISSYLGGGLYGSISRMEYLAFDKIVMQQLNDYNAIYRDGALGGFTPLNTRGNLTAQNRINAGYKEGEAEVASIIANLKRDENGKIIETIKIVTHSMGGAYGQGYAKAILDYIDKMGIGDVQIDFMAHFAPFQPNELEEQKHLKLGDILQFSHEFDSWAGNEKIRGATYMKTSNAKGNGHSIFNFLQYIQDLPQGKYVIINGRLVPQN